jgi:peptidoglycan/LPS O-acetylase OafA/YrhL
METTTTQTALKWGAIAGVLIIIISTIGYVFKIETNTTYTTSISILYYLVFPVLFMILGMNEFKNDNGGFMSYGQGLGIGAMMGGVAGLISGIFSFLYLTFIDNSVMERMKELQITKMEEQGLSSDQIEQSMEIMKKFSSPGMVMVFSMIGLIVVYFIISLVVSAVQKKEKSVFE